MALTKKQKQLCAELEEISEIVAVDYWNIEDYDVPSRTIQLDLMKRALVNSWIIGKYTLIDETLGGIICRYFFPKRPFHELWRTKRFQLFNYHIIESMSLLRKLDLAREVKDIPSSVQDTIKRTNTLRNAIAHLFFPENKSEFQRFKKVVYKGRDVYSVDGLRSFAEDADAASDHLMEIFTGVNY